MITVAQLANKTCDELESLAKEQKITGYSSLRKSELIFQILKSQAEREGNLFLSGDSQIAG